jgi:hypothetical protein
MHPLFRVAIELSFREGAQSLTGRTRSARDFCARAARANAAFYARFTERVAIYRAFTRAASSSA